MSAKIQAAVSRVVPGPPEPVFERLLDVAGYADWWPSAVRFRSEEPLRAGARFQMEALGGRFVIETVQLEPGRSIWFRFVSGPYAGTGEWLLEPAEGGTRVAYRLRAEPISRWFRLLSRFVDLGRLHGSWADQALSRLRARSGPRQ